MRPYFTYTMSPSGGLMGKQCEGVKDRMSIFVLKCFLSIILYTIRTISWNSFLAFLLLHRNIIATQ